MCLQTCSAEGPAETMIWVAVKELSLSYYNERHISGYICTHYGSLALSSLAYWLLVGNDGRQSLHSPYIIFSYIPY